MDSVGYIRVRVRATGQVLNMLAREARFFLNTKPPRVERVEDGIETAAIDHGARAAAVAPPQHAKGRRARA